ncbi:MAG: TIGR00730 family Rossman fold protein [Planctomyces sp.]|nr:TIGR00730 family Rossman fold protein [Planctomyces sp.]
MFSVCVFCGSRHGLRENYARAAAELGAEIARRDWRLVYGGGNIGLMGVLADAALAEGGEVLGVIPDHLLEKELGHQGVTTLQVVRSMHERKALMAAESSAFVALPGGLGTLEELAEIWTWRQLNLHHKPIGLLNTGGFFDSLLGFLDRAVVEEFVRPAHRDVLLVDSSPPALLDSLYAARTVDRPLPVERT